MKIFTLQGEDGIEARISQGFFDTPLRELMQTVAVDAEKLVADNWLPKAMQLPALAEYRGMLAQRGTVLTAAASLREQARQVDAERQQLLAGNGDNPARQLAELQQQCAALEQRLKIATIASGEFSKELAPKLSELQKQRDGIAQRVTAAQQAAAQYGEALAVQLGELQQRQDSLVQRAKAAEQAATEFDTSLSSRRRSAELTLKMEAQKFDATQAGAAAMKRFAIEQRIEESGLRAMLTEYVRWSLHSCESALQAAAARLLEQ